jgi:tetratricopeptide (TPR) repeat protein
MAGSTVSPDHRWLAAITPSVEEMAQSKGPLALLTLLPRLQREANLCRVRLIDVRTGGNGPALESPEVNFAGAAFSGNGQRLAVCAGSGAKVWDVATGKKLFTVVGHEAQALRLAFSPDGLWLATGSGADNNETKDRTKKHSTEVKLHDLTTGQTRWSIHPDAPPAQPLVFSPDGAALVTPGKGGTLLLWRLPGGTVRLTLPRQRSRVKIAVFSRDSARLATAGFNDIVHVWDARTGRLQHALRGHTRSLASLAFSPDGRHLVSSTTVAGGSARGGLRPGEVKVWDLQTGREVLTLDGQGELLFSPDGQRLAGAGKAYALRLWDASEPTPEEAARRRQAWLDDKRSWHERRATESEAGRQHFAAIFHLGELIRLEPKHSGWYYRRGEEYAAQGELVEAIEDFTRAIDLGAKKGVPCFTRRGVIWELLGQHKKAVLDLTAALRRGEPAEARLFQRRGEAFLALWQPERAIADFTEAIKMDRKSGICWAARGEAHAMLGLWNEAGDDLDRALAIDPGNIIDWDHRLLVHLASGQIDAYRKMVAKMVNRFGQDADPETAHYLGMACIRIPGTVDEVTLLRLASAAVDRKVTPVARTPDQRFLLGAALYRSNHLAAALEELQAAERARAQPSDLDALFTALACGRLGKKNEGRATLGRAIELIDEAERGKTMPWQQRITRLALRREAEELVK